MELSARKTLKGIRHLSFSLEQELYCIDILKVKELLGLPPITPLPQTPSFIKGVINLRGQIIPLIDLRLKFGMPFKEYSKRTSIIVVELDYEQQKMLFGLVVDAIHEVVQIPEEAVSRLPYLNARIKAEYIQGVISQANKPLMILLDVLRILKDDDIAQLQASSLSSISET